MQIGDLPGVLADKEATCAGRHVGIPLSYCSVYTNRECCDGSVMRRRESSRAVSSKSPLKCHNSSPPTLACLLPYYRRRLCFFRCRDGDAEPVCGALQRIAAQRQLAHRAPPRANSTSASARARRASVFPCDELLLSCLLL